MKFFTTFFLFFVFNNTAHAIIGDGGAGWAQMPYLSKILLENIKRHQQLRMLIQSVEGNHEYLKIINQGIDNSIGLLNTFPIEDENVLQELETLIRAYESHGEVSLERERKMHQLHDKSVAESVRMAGDIRHYAQKQEQNALTLAQQGRVASPKGAARMNVDTNARILHTLNQLLRINGQMLKLQSEHLAMANKGNKDNAGHFNKINQDVRKSLKTFSQGLALPRF